MKYIDVDKLVAEIERRREKCADIAADEKNEEVAEYYRGKEVAYDETSSLINSLQQEQPEVELEKEITPSLVENMLCEFGVQSIEDVDSECLADIARHFYELGRLSNK